MIKFKLIYIFMLIVSFIYAKLSGGNFPYYIFYILFLVGIVEVIYFYICTKYVYCNFRILKKSFIVGDNEEIKLIVKNDSFIPLPYVKVKSSFFEHMCNDYKGNGFYLKQDGSYFVRKQIRFIRRGVYGLGKTDITINDIFNISTISIKAEHDENIMVYPKIYELDEIDKSYSNMLEEVIVKKKFLNNNSDVRDVREYTNGDSIKKIHWKISAKENKLYVKNYEKLSGGDTNIFLNMESLEKVEDYTAKEEELMIDFTLSFLNQILKREIKSNIYINNDYEKVFKIENNEDFQILGEYFLRNYSNSNESFSEFILKKIKNLNNSSDVVIITLTLMKEDINNIIYLRNIGYNLKIFYYDKNIYESQILNELKDMNIEIYEFNKIIKF